ncbi:MAG: FMN-binding protein [Peptostreptococcaceae bacterium]|nr:FMN-binding protein [Peptostreptococcaceae bacterium]
MKNFKKVGILVLVLIMALTVFTACAKDEPTPAPTPEPTPEATLYTDGTYTAEQADFDAEKGWKDNATVTITDGKISAVVLNSTSSDAAKGDKLSEVAAGNYDMVAGGAKSAWDVQAKAIQDYIVSTQDTTSITFDAEGKADAISGATISYGHFFDLVNEALAQAEAK